MADRMRKARLDAGLSQKQIADLIGISRGSAINYENGQTRPLRAILAAWAEATGTYPEWLTTGRIPTGRGLQYLVAPATGLEPVTCRFTDSGIFERHFIEARHPAARN